MTRRYGTRVCSVCGQEIEPGDVAFQRNGFPHHWDCPDEDVTA